MTSSSGAAAPAAAPPIHLLFMPTSNPSYAPSPAPSAPPAPDSPAATETGVAAPETARDPPRDEVRERCSVPRPCERARGDGGPLVEWWKSAAGLCAACACETGEGEAGAVDCCGGAPDGAVLLGKEKSGAEVGGRT